MFKRFAVFTTMKKTEDGFTYRDPAKFHEYFAADLSAEQAAVMGRSQVLNVADNFKGCIEEELKTRRAEAWLKHRSLATLDETDEVFMVSTAEIVEFLDGR